MAFKVDFRDEGLWASRVIAADWFNTEAVWVTFFVEGGRLVALNADECGAFRGEGGRLMGMRDRVTEEHERALAAVKRLERELAQLEAECESMRVQLRDLRTDRDEMRSWLDRQP